MSSDNGYDTLQEKNDIDRRVDVLLRQMTLEEKVSLLSGRDFWTLPAIERLGIPALKVADGPTGLRSTNSDPSTVFPVGTAIAATWDVGLAEAVGAAIGREAIAHGVDVLLAPAVNIHRTPLGGRNFETYSEDPHLAGEIGAGYVVGVQKQGVGTSLKHYAANNQEHERLRGSSNMTERTLREIYLTAFETIVKKANPWTVMGAYNKVNGTFACEHGDLLVKTLKGAWGYDGVVVSDWGATKTTVEAANNGLDLEMPGPAKHFGRALIEAVQNNQVSMATLDDHARRVLKLIVRCGLLDGDPKRSKAALNTSEHRTLARKAAAASMVLLKNEGNCLPLSPDLKNVAVIGGPARLPAIQGGGSSQVSPDRVIAPIDGIAAALGEGASVRFAHGVDHEPRPPILDGQLLSPTSDGAERGLLARYYDEAGCTGKIVHEELDWRFAKLGFGRVAQSADRLDFSVAWSGFITPERDGLYTFVSTHSNRDVTLTIGDETLIDEATPRETEFLFEMLPLNRRTAQIALKARTAYPIRITYSQPKDGAIKEFNIFNVFLRAPIDPRASAIEAAQHADAAIVFVGTGTTAETEGRDRETMRLSDHQNQLVRDVAAANARTIVVVNTGAPVEMPWVSDVSAILQMWLPGQEAGAAIGDILTGRETPSGKLPTSFPKHYEDNPTYIHYPGGKNADYGEGVFVGYRYYDKADIDTLYPFGHGLSYTSFAYGPIEAASKILIGDSLTLSLPVTNTGPCRGAEIVQIYVADLATAEAMPPRQLRAFHKVDLAPGETKDVRVELGPRAFSWFDDQIGDWTITQGRYLVHAAASSRDLRQTLELEISR